MSVHSEIDRIRENIAQAYSAVGDRGGTLPEQRNSGNLAEAIRSITGGKTGTEAPAPEEVYRTARPASWLTIPEPEDDEMYLLVHITDGLSTLLAFTVTCSGSYTVELGTISDGGVFSALSSTAAASGEVYETELFASAYDGLTDSGMKQAVVRITGTDILTWEPSAHSGKTAPLNFSGWNIVEIKCRLPKGTAVLCGNGTKNRELRGLRFFTWDGPGRAASMSGMFNNCSALTAVLNLDTSGVTDMSNLFNGCASLTAIPGLNTANVTNMNSMFKGCASLAAIPLLDTAKVTDLGYLFSGCAHLLSVPPLDTSKAANMTNMFYGCSAIAAVPPLDCTEATAMGNIFSGCYALTDIPVLKVAKAASVGSMFYNCLSLGEIRFDPAVTGWTGGAISLQNCSMGHEALVRLLNSLPEVTTARILTLTGNPGAEELTESEKAVANRKNWTVKV